jgi:solute carrier family 25 uncoupling protein 27
MMNQDPRNPTYRGSVDCLVRTLRSEGWRGLYKGFLPTWARLAPWQLAFWTSYEQIRRLGGLQPF